MATQLTFEYDVLGDVMYIEKCRPYASQESDDLECGVVARLHPATEEIESLEIIFYSTRILRRNPVQLEIPVTAGRIFDQPAAPEFDCLALPGSPWLTIPPDAQITELYIPLRSEAATETPAPAATLA